MSRNFNNAGSSRIYGQAQVQPAAILLSPIISPRTHTAHDSSSVEVASTSFSRRRQGVSRGRRGVTDSRGPDSSGPSPQYTELQPNAKLEDWIRANVKLNEVDAEDEDDEDTMDVVKAAVNQAMIDCGTTNITEGQIHSYLQQVLKPVVHPAVMAEAERWAGEVAEGINRHADRIFGKEIVGFINGGMLRMISGNYPIEWVDVKWNPDTKKLEEVMSIEEEDLIPSADELICHTSRDDYQMEAKIRLVYEIEFDEDWFLVATQNFYHEFAHCLRIAAVHHLLCCVAMNLNHQEITSTTVKLADKLIITCHRLVGRMTPPASWQIDGGWSKFGTDSDTHSGFILEHLVFGGPLAYFDPSSSQRLVSSMEFGGMVYQYERYYDENERRAAYYFHSVKEGDVHIEESEWRGVRSVVAFSVQRKGPKQFPDLYKVEIRTSGHGLSGTTLTRKKALEDGPKKLQGAQLCGMQR